MAAQNYDDGPEVALQHYPEVIPPQPSQTPLHGQPYPAQPPPTSASYAGSPALSTGKTDGSYIPIPSATQYQLNPHYYNPLASQDSPHDGSGAKYGRRPGPFGCTLIVFWLSAIIAVLSVAVIGLAAGTGVEANRANNAEKSLARLSGTTATATTASATSASATSTSTSFASIDFGCSNQPDTITGTLYTSYQFLGQETFTIHCNKDAQGNPLMSLFVADFETCIDACSGYTKYTTSTFKESNSNTTCGGVSFIPLWTKKANATLGGAPGNCYLKPAPQNISSLPVPDIGTECHAATLNSK